MQRCNRCKMNIRGYKEACPLCGGPLTGEATEDVFPREKKKKFNRALVIRIAAFLMIATILVMASLHYMIGYRSWMTLTSLAVVIGFADILGTMYYRSNPLKTMTWQVYAAMLINVVVDKYTGWHAWSVTWVLPAVFLALMIVTIIIGLALHMRLQDFVLYLLLHELLSLVQLIFVRNGANPIPLPAMISMLVTGIFCIGVVIFRWKDFKSASTRYFNM